MALKEEGSSANENSSFLDGSSVRGREMRVSVGRLAFMEYTEVHKRNKSMFEFPALAAAWQAE